MSQNLNETDALVELVDDTVVLSDDEIDLTPISAEEWAQIEAEATAASFREVQQTARLLGLGLTCGD